MHRHVQWGQARGFPAACPITTGDGRLFSPDERIKHLVPGCMHLGQREVASSSWKALSTCEKQDTGIILLLYILKQMKLNSTSINRA